MLRRPPLLRLLQTAAAWAGLASAAGCGTLKSQTATDQLLLSDAVDRAVAKIDFGPLRGRKVYLDTQYIKSIKASGVVTTDYVVSSLRQQLLANGCRLQEKPEAADIVLELRLGALGSDAHEVTYGLPASNVLNTATSILPNAPPLPRIPEISLAKKADQRGAAKISLFAYDRATRSPVWQSGVSLARSSATDIWVLGAGPFQKGTIYRRPQFAGSELQLPLVAEEDSQEDARLAEYAQPRVFAQPAAPSAETELAERPPAEPPGGRDVRQAGYQEEAEAKPAGADGERRTRGAGSSRRARPAPSAEQDRAAAEPRAGAASDK